MKNLVILSAAILSMSLSMPAFADVGDARFVPARSFAPPPEAFRPRAEAAAYDWRMVFAASKAPRTDPSEAGRVTSLFTPGAALMVRIDEVNVRQNAITRTESGGRRDCVAYVKAKSEALQRIGVPESALSPAVVLTHGGIVHAVLILTTSDGDVVLDNLSSYIHPWGAVDYIWVKRRLASDSEGHWAWVGERSGDTVQKIASR